MRELDKIKVSYQSGELKALEKQLKIFVQSNKEQIFKFKAEEEKFWHRELSLESTIKLYIMYVRSIDLEAEMKDQIKALEENPVAKSEDIHRQNDVCLSWIKRNASVWRGYRVLAIIYVFNQNKEKFISLLE